MSEKELHQMLEVAEQHTQHWEAEAKRLSAALRQIAAGEMFLDHYEVEGHDGKGWKKLSYARQMSAAEFAESVLK